LSGYVRLYRGWRDCDVFADEPMSEREAWLWLIEHAAWKPIVRTNAKGERVKIDRGQLHVSLRALEKVFGWGKNKVARYLQRLEDHEMIGTATGQSGTILTVLNYSKYQDDRDSRDTETGTATGQSRDTHKEGKEGKEESKPAPKRGPRPDYAIPDFVPAEPWAAYDTMRKRKKAPMDGYIAEKQFKKLAQFAASGWDIAKILDKATVNNWTDLFEPTPGRDDAMRANPSRAANDAPKLSTEEQRAYVEHVAKKFGRMNPDATLPAERIGKPITLASLAAAQVGGHH